MTTDPVERYRRRGDRNRLYNLAMLAVVAVGVAVITTAFIVGLVKFDAKISHMDQTVTTVRVSQVANARIAAARSDCQTSDFNKIITIVDLATAGDRNRADYPKVTKC